MTPGWFPINQTHHTELKRFFLSRDRAYILFFYVYKRRWSAIHILCSRVWAVVLLHTHRHYQLSRFNVILTYICIHRFSRIFFFLFKDASLTFANSSFIQNVASTTHGFVIEGGGEKKKIDMNKIFTLALLTLFMIQISFVNSNKLKKSNCDTEKCPSIPKHYEELGCEAIKSDDDCCTRRWEWKSHDFIKI